MDDERTSGTVRLLPAILTMHSREARATLLAVAIENASTLNIKSRLEAFQMVNEMEIFLGFPTKRTDHG